MLIVLGCLQDHCGVELFCVFCWMQTLACWQAPEGASLRSKSQVDDCILANMTLRAI